MASPRDPTRLRHGLNPITTSSLGGFNAQMNTPISAVSMASSYAQSAQTPGSAIQPYNPQEWMPPPAPAPAPVVAPPPERPHQFQLESQAPPPPPYSPPRRSHQPRPMSTAFEHTMVLASTPPPPRMTPTNPLRPSPEPATNRSFPPPPGVGGRGGSRERRFGLPTLGRRKDPETPSSSSPEPQRSLAYARRSMGPMSFQPQEPERGPSPAFIHHPEGIPPASRRAASTGAIDTPTSARSRSTSQAQWEPGMPLPPPPPGPPPSGSRSQSVQSIDRATVPIISPPTRRPPPSGVSSLGPVPPTPADWVDTDAQPSTPSEPLQVSRGRSPGLTIDTETANTSDQVPEGPASSSSASGLNRAKAVRHDKTIIQRRNESRTRHTSRNSLDATALISDILVPTSANGLTRKLTINKSTPRSGGFDLPRTGDSSNFQDSRNSTPRAPASAKLPRLDTATPPFSPFPVKLANQANSSQSLVPKALPTPPPQVISASSSRPRDSSRPPVSATTPSLKQLFVSQSGEQFANATIERFQAFAVSESAATSDADRVRMFADFIVNESRIRRERYSAAIGAMGSEIFDLTRDLFRPMATARRESVTSPEEFTPASSNPNRSHRGSISSSHQGEGLSNSAPVSANLPASPSGGNPPANGNWTSNYMPSLSPILSMSVSDNYENGSSRGRPPSRWWEADSQGDPVRGFERSKRESKYMGVPKDKWEEPEQSTAAYGATIEQGSSSNYPPEKTGWHESDEAAWTPQPLRLSNPSLGSTPSPASNSQGLLDVSRLVTMPPPYPRHHPAVNNSHPQLSSVRASVRTMTEITEVDSCKERFNVGSSRRREEFSKASSERRQALRVNLQREIESGNLGYADAAAIESDSQGEERDKKKELEKSEYEHFQNQVILPLNDLLTERISRATDLFDDVTRRLFDNGEIDADMPQEEGDDRPELLEKLTLLKWIFEMREGLHRVIYDLLSDRNYRYREVVMTPYRLAGNDEKLRHAEVFFAEDAAKREYAYANEVLDRAREFRSVMEEAAVHGVELQLSAFWDIAPPLRRLLDSIPLDLDGFSIQIPQSEFDENPAYRDHPLQYLFSLLLHAEKSTYQFIEAHTNLLCLLHEVKEAVVNAKARVLETQVTEMDGTAISAEERQLRASTMRQAEDRRLSEDLKEKVRVVQDQWNSSLGEGIKNVKERAGEWLLQTGGWDESLEEGTFGGA